MNRPRHTQKIHIVFAIAAGAGLMAACGSNVQLGSQDRNSGGAGGSGGVTGSGGILPAGGTVGGGGTTAAGGATGPGGTSGTGKTCGGVAGLPCAAGEVCDLGLNPLCVSDAFGTCVAKPQVCTADWRPVCGCDGTTYSNDCVRLSTDYGNLSKRSDGACPSVDAGVGGSTGTGGSTRTGGATATTGGSTRTGGATGAGGATGSGGTGGSTGQTCGGVVGLPCAAGEICDLGTDPLCMHDGFGTCVVKPQGCTTDWKPVCGCDGTTYSNDCTRLSRGYSGPKRSDGACPSDAGVGGSTGTGGSTRTGGATGAGGTAGTGGTTGTGGTGGSTSKTCGGRAPSPCAANEICDATPGFCDVADMTGTCVVKPQVCSDIYRPVCGCNGTTYPNDCERQAAGVFKNFDGACPTTDAGQDAPLSVDASSLAALCTATGGQVGSQLCCNSATDFPNSCLGGACGCAPESSHTVSVCTCTTGCFVPASGCVACTVGADQTCNNDPTISSLHGQCVGGRCSCGTGWPLLANGKCQ